MAQFIEIPALEIGRNGQWTLYGDLVYESDLVEGPITVPEGFETDLASIPRIFTPVFPKNGRHRPAAIVHDFLCREGIFPRKLSDKIFLEAMKLFSVPKWRRWAMFAAVRIGAIFGSKKK